MKTWLMKGTLTVTLKWEYFKTLFLFPLGLSGSRGHVQETQQTKDELALHKPETLDDTLRQGTERTQIQPIMVSIGRAGRSSDISQSGKVFLPLCYIILSFLRHKDSLDLYGFLSVLIHNSLGFHVLSFLIHDFLYFHVFIFHTQGILIFMFSYLFSCTETLDFHIIYPHEQLVSMGFFFF